MSLYSDLRTYTKDDFNSLCSAQKRECNTGQSTCDQVFVELQSETAKTTGLDEFASFPMLSNSASRSCHQCRVPKHCTFHAAEEAYTGCHTQLCSDCIATAQGALSINLQWNPLSNHSWGNTYTQPVFKLLCAKNSPLLTKDVPVCSVTSNRQQNSATLQFKSTKSGGEWRLI